MPTIINDQAFRDAVHRSFVNAWCDDSKIIIENNGALYYATSLSRYMGHSGIFRTEASTNATTIVTMATEFSTRFQNPVALACRPGVEDDLIAAAKQKGFRHAETYCVMIRNSALPLPTHAKILTVNDLGTLDRFRDVMAGVWNFAIAEDDLRSFFTANRTIESDDVMALMVHANGHDVAGAVLEMNSDIADIFWVGCKPESRLQGYGSLVTAVAANTAFAMGAQAAALQTTEENLPFYKSLNFHKIYSYELWITPSEQLRADQPR